MTIEFPTVMRVFINMVRTADSRTHTVGTSRVDSHTAADIRTVDSHHTLHHTRTLGLTPILEGHQQGLPEMVLRSPQNHRNHVDLHQNRDQIHRDYHQNF